MASPVQRRRIRRETLVQRVLGPDYQVHLRGDRFCSASSWKSTGHVQRAAVQATGSKQPAISSGHVDCGGKPTPVFDGTDDAMVMPDGALVAAADSTWIAVVRSPTADATERWIAECASGRLGILWTRSLAAKHYFFNALDAGQFAASSPEANRTQDLAYVFDEAADTCRLFEEGVDRGAIAWTGNNDVDGDLGIGAIFNGGANYFSGPIPEFVIASRKVCVPELARIHDHHRQRYGIAA